MAELGRPVENDDDTVAMTLRVPRAYHAKLSNYARRCGIRSVNSYSLFMLISHSDKIEAAERELDAADIPSVTEMIWP